jgi:tRNA A37 threonylcarbamoyladenosine synthetase subunit TsaC/SUA5/YrdC
LPDLILDGGKISKNVPSTIVAFGGNGPVIIREGALAGKVREFLEM